MAAYNGYRVKDRTAKLNRKRNAMPVNNKGAFVVQAVIEKKAALAAARAAEAARKMKGAE